MFNNVTNLTNQQIQEQQIQETDNLIPQDQENEENEIFQSLDEIIYEDFENKLQNNNLNDIQEEKTTENISISFDQAAIDYQNGIKEAFDYIFEHYYPKLERLSKRQNDEDLVQELSIVLLKAIETFNPNGGAKFNTYFWKCARNAMGTLNIRKNAKKRTAENGVVSMQQSFNTKDSQVELGTFIEDQNSSEDLDKSVFNIVLEKNIFPYLKESDIKCIKMYLNRYTLEEIGAALNGITAPAVHVKLRRLANKKNVGKQLKSLYDMC